MTRGAYVGRLPMYCLAVSFFSFFFFQAEDGIRDSSVTGVQTCALPISIRRTMQSVAYLPHFLSWVIVIALWQQVFGGAGFINQLLRNQGVDAVNMMSNPDFAKPLFILQAIWKEMGWGTIIFLAALSNMTAELYEADAVYGAGRRQRLR